MNQEPFENILRDYEHESRLRSIPGERGDESNKDFVTNDYLGLGAKEGDFRGEFQRRYGEASFTTSASRLLARKQRCHGALESHLKSRYGKEVLLFNSGYHANVGVVQALTLPETVFLCDKLIHASMIDGLSAAKSNYVRWRHNDVGTLERLLEKYRSTPIVVVMVESIYSMDGDVSPLLEIVELKRRYPNVLLYVDEAHGFGVRGARGLGLCEELGILDDVDIIIGTLGKASASSGAFAATSELLFRLMVNRSRSFIFSTAMPPINQCWSLMMIETIEGMKEERNHLKVISRRFKEGIERITGEKNVSDSQIVPLIVGEASKTVQLAGRLRELGVDALPIRRPTVPPGGERIRFSLSAAMSSEEIDDVLELVSMAYREVIEEKDCH